MVRCNSTDLAVSGHLLEALDRVHDVHIDRKPTSVEVQRPTAESKLSIEPVEPANVVSPRETVRHPALQR